MDIIWGKIRGVVCETSEWAWTSAFLEGNLIEISMVYFDGLALIILALEVFERNLSGVLCAVAHVDCLGVRLESVEGASVLFTVLDGVKCACAAVDPGGQRNVASCSSSRAALSQISPLGWCFLELLHFSLSNHLLDQQLVLLFLTYSSHLCQLESVHLYFLNLFLLL